MEELKVAGFPSSGAFHCGNLGSFVALILVKVPRNEMKVNMRTSCLFIIMYLCIACMKCYACV